MIKNSGITVVDPCVFVCHCLSEIIDFLHNVTVLSPITTGLQRCRGCRDAFKDDRENCQALCSVSGARIPLVSLMAAQVQVAAVLPS